MIVFSSFLDFALQQSFVESWNDTFFFLGFSSPSLQSPPLLPLHFYSPNHNPPSSVFVFSPQIPSGRLKHTMNTLRFVGDMTHLISILVLLFRISATQSCSGISMKTQELYVLVFLARFFLPLYNTIMKLVFIASSLAVVLCMREHKAVKRSYDKDFDSCRHDFLIATCLASALLFCERFAFQEIFWTFSICLEAVAILPQIVLLQRSGDVDNLKKQYVFSLGAYCAFYILYWIDCDFTEQHFSRRIVGVSAIVQTALYADFYYHYHICWENKRKLLLIFLKQRYGEKIGRR